MQSIDARDAFKVFQQWQLPFFEGGNVVGKGLGVVGGNCGGWIYDSSWAGQFRRINTARSGFHRHWYDAGNCGEIGKSSEAFGLESARAEGGFDTAVCAISDDPALVQDIAVWRYI